MPSIQSQVAFVVGVDTHKHTHTASVVDRQGAECAHLTVPAEAAGYRRLLRFASTRAPGARLWALEGSGSYGRGLTTFLLERTESVAEIDRPKRPARRNGAKSDALDATRAGREALAREHLVQPRRRGLREGLRVLLRTRDGAVDARRRAVCHLQALIVTAAEPLQQRLRALATDALVKRCARLRSSPRHDVEHRATIQALRATAQRVRALDTEAAQLFGEIKRLMRTAAPQLLAEPGVGPITAAEVYCAWSHAGRLRSEAAFATLAGVAPIPASSGQVTRYRLNRGGDRKLNRALHTIAIHRLRHHPDTQRYAARRSAEGKSDREIRRCLKRYIARRLFRLLEAMPMTT